MKFSDFIDIAKENPQVLDYELRFADFFNVDVSDLNEVKDDIEFNEDNVQVVTDFPICGIAISDEAKEVRFILQGSDFSVIEQTRDNIVHLVRKKIKDIGNNQLEENDEEGEENGI